MPLPTRPNPNEDDGKKRLPLPTEFPKPGTDDSIPLVAPPKHIGRNLDDTLKGTFAQTKRRDFQENEYLLSDITVEEATELNYDKVFKHLQDKILEVKTWLQEHITENQLTERVANARTNRGPALAEVKGVLSRILTGYFIKNPAGDPQENNKIIGFILNEILGYGPIEPLFSDPTITEIMVNGPKKVYFERKGKISLAKGVQFRDKEHLLELCQQMLQQIGRVLDLSHPKEDGRLPDGSRINATHWIIGPSGPFLTIRRFPEEIFSFQTLLDKESITPEMAEEIGNLIYHKSSTIISGGTGSGKTSMLNALSGCIPLGERIVTIEDSLELRLHPDRHVVPLEARKSLQGENSTATVTIRDLVVNALRMKPNRIVVGEVRDSTALDMLQAFNTGHEGSLSTIHSNNPRAAIERLSNLVAQAGELDSDRALALIASSVDIIIQVAQYEDGSRRVSEIVEIPSRVTIQEGKFTLEPITLWEYEQTGYNDNGDIVGHYKKVNDLSEEYIKSHRLDRRKHLSLVELLEVTNYVTKSSEDEVDHSQEK